MDLYYQPDIASLALSEDESKHCVRVLRHQTGDTIHIVDGKGGNYKVVITDANPKKCRFAIIDQQLDAATSYRISIALAPTKNQDRTEWFVEKATEIGVDEIVFYISKHSERRKINLDRIKKKALAAMKQSGQSYLPRIELYNSFEECIRYAGRFDERFIAFVDSDNPDHLKDKATASSASIVMIGPEGDFSIEELEYALDSGFIKVSLGRNRLRTETAGIAACHILNLVNQ